MPGLNSLPAPIPRWRQVVSASREGLLFGTKERNKMLIRSVSVFTSKVSSISTPPRFFFQRVAALPAARRTSPIPGSDRAPHFSVHLWEQRNAWKRPVESNFSSSPSPENEVSETYRGFTLNSISNFEDLSSRLRTVADHWAQDQGILASRVTFANRLRTARTFLLFRTLGTGDSGMDCRQRT